MGVLSVLFSSGAAPSAATRDRLVQISPLIARALSPMRSLVATARLVQGASAGAVLLRDGSTYALAGLADHAVLCADSPVVGIAQEILLSGQVSPIVHVAGRRRPPSL